MATNCELIEENLPSANGKYPISASASMSSMSHEEKQDGTEKSLSKSSFSDMSSEPGINSIGGLGGDNSGELNLPNNQPLPLPAPQLPHLIDDVFESAFEASMADLEHAEIDGYETDTESSLSDDSSDTNQAEGKKVKSTIAKSFPRSSSFQYESSSDSSSSDSEDNDDNGINRNRAVELLANSNQMPKYFSADIFHMRPYLMPFTERRRLSQCKEEEDEDDADKSPLPSVTDAGNVALIAAIKQDRSSNKPTPPPLPPPATDQASAEKFKELERLRQQFMHKIDSINTSNIEEIKTVTVAPEHSSPPPPPPIPPTILPPALINLLESAKAPPTKLPLTFMANAKVTNSSIAVTNPNTTIVRGKFTITRAQETPEIPATLRVEAQNLQHLKAASNAHTISFPCSSGDYASVQNVFPQRQGSNKYPLAKPHFSKEFFDTSLIEIRTPTDSLNSINNMGLETSSSPVFGQKQMQHQQQQQQPSNCDTNVQKLKRMSDFPDLDEVWIKRGDISSTITKLAHIQQQQQQHHPKKYYYTDESAAESGRTTAVQSEDEQDAKLPTSRPSSAPAEPNAKAARKANKKMKEEARRQEKEQSRREKEARKIERETARRLEREAAKLEKLNRNAEKISRSTERVAASSRSGSLERRRSGEDSPVLNQSTVHGIASPNRRPTIFDVFRPSKRQKEKILLDPLSAAAAAAGTGNETGSASSTHSATGGGGVGVGGTGGGVMNSMKVALQNSGLIGGGHHHHHHHKQHPAVTITTAEGTSVKSKYKDGSAHPHQGSDAQYYHTVTAVRRADATRSPMTKVMDLFRNRSNSAASEADKRKAVCM
uniref:Uncharacterized protein n=1 Tax=Glossina palpalis gambiensis TaxID=67801 RepID=A0A1B0C523_9MUSC